ncbi:MAG: diaminopimelate epimerase [Saprospiraceae bacterium]|nr:diaminopimelate epimerase [Saprospiraceae bacterium]
MSIPFYKYQGTGNDFVIIDQFDNQYLQPGDQETIARFCDRRFGIGADGLMLLMPSEKADFRMIYFNADGYEGSLCGNGSRCAVACMNRLKRVLGQTIFEASDGLHKAIIQSDRWIDLKMSDLNQIEEGKGFYVLDTGSPHYVTFVEDLSDLDIVQSGQVIRYSDRYRENGINVNFVEERDYGIEVNTYERGVENETLSCGTGVTAAALAHALKHQINDGPVAIKTKGGELSVRFHRNNHQFSEIWLCGPAEFVFSGSIQI